MIRLSEEIEVVANALFLLSCVLITVHSYINYKKRKFTQLFITFGYLLLSIGMAITLIKIIMDLDRLFLLIGLPFGIGGILLIFIGLAKERRKKNA